MLRMHALPLDDDIGGSGADSSVSNASVSPAEGTGSTNRYAEESARARAHHLQSLVGRVVSHAPPSESSSGSIPWIGSRYIRLVIGHYGEASKRVEAVSSYGASSSKGTKYSGVLRVSGTNGIQWVMWSALGRGNNFSVEMVGAQVEYVIRSWWGYGLHGSPSISKYDDSWRTFIRHLLSGSPEALPGAESRCTRSIV
ncbi:hypothetical protein Tco_0969784 [Tanacetum coccineum]